MKKFIYIFLFTAYCLLPTAYLSYASYEKVGTTGSQFLKIPMGARPIGMGGAFCGLCDDINAIFFNPAGLTQIEKGEIALTYISWFEDVNSGYFAYTRKIGNFGTVGISITYFNIGNIPRTSINQDGECVDEGKNFSAWDISPQISYAKKLPKNVSFGINLKAIKRRIDNVSSNLGFAIDLGILHKPQVKIGPGKIRSGLLVQNLGTKMKFEDEYDAMPINIKLGVAYILNFNQNKLNFTLDGNYPLDNRINGNFGVEYIYKNFLSIRSGFKTETVSDIDFLSGLSLGAGFKIGRYGIDYAWIPYGDLGNTHRISLLIRF